MGLRFQKRIPITKGLTLNISKTGISFTVGGRGASVNLGRGGLSSNVGLPGTGVSWREKLGLNNVPKLVMWLVAVAVLFWWYSASK